MAKDLCYYADLHWPAPGQQAALWPFRGLRHVCTRPSRAAATIAPTALSGSGHAASGHAAVWWPSPCLKWWKSVAEQIAGRGSGN